MSVIVESERLEVLVTGIQIPSALLPLGYALQEQLLFLVSNLLAVLVSERMQSVLLLFELIGVHVNGKELYGHNATFDRHSVDFSAE